MAETQQDTTEQTKDGAKPKTRKQTSPTSVKDVEARLGGEIKILEQHIHDLQDALDLSNKVIVCLLLTNCRGLGDLGYEKILKRYWSTTGGVVFDEDTFALQKLLNDIESSDVLEFFLEDLMGKRFNLA